MRSEQLRQAAEMHRIEVRSLHRWIEARRLLGQMISDCANGLLQRADELLRQFRMNVVTVDLRAMQLTPATQNTLDRFSQVTWRYRS